MAYASMEFFKIFKREKAEVQKEDVSSQGEQSYKRIPVGSPRELQEKAVKWPAFEVKNRVLWVRPLMENCPLIYRRRRN